MTTSYYTSYTKAQDSYGEFMPVIGFHRSMLEAGIRRVETLVSQKFSRHTYFLQLICRSAMTHHGDAHTILLESFGHPLLAIQNLSYTLQPFQERKVYIVHVEEAYAKWMVQTSHSPWTSFLVGTLCVALLTSILRRV